MIYTPQSTYDARQRVLFKQLAEKKQTNSPPRASKESIRAGLRALGVTRWGMLWPENRALHQVIYEGELIHAIVYGHCREGTGLLAASERRVIFLDKTPFFIKYDELTYDIITGVNYGQSGFWSTLTLHSRIRDYHFRTMNMHCARNFRDYIENRCLEHSYVRYDNW